MPPVKLSLPLALLAAVTLCACNTIENRRSLYSTEKVHGPYTRELEEGTWGNPKTVDQQYADTQAEKRYPKIISGEKKPTGGTSHGTSVPATNPDTPLPN
jgi:hypothetical protein